MTLVTWTYPDGTGDHPVLPQTWKNISGINEANAERHGFIRVETEVPEPSDVRVYSKLRLYDALVEAGLWEHVKTAIEEAGQWDRWTIANDLSTDYAPFAAILRKMRETYGEDTADAILAKAEV